jgi:hypothetical protein
MLGESSNTHAAEDSLEGVRKRGNIHATSSRKNVIDPASYIP